MLQRYSINSTGIILQELAPNHNINSIVDLHTVHRRATVLIVAKQLGYYVIASSEQKSKMPPHNCTTQLTAELQRASNRGTLPNYNTSYL